MYFDPGCIPCLIKQASNAAKLFTNDKDLQLKIVKEACREVLTVDGNFTAPMFSATVQLLIEETLKVENPYQKLKEENLIKAKRFIPYLQEMVEDSEDKLEMAVRVAIAGNVIDLGANPNFNIEHEVSKITSTGINLSAFNQFKEDLSKADSILYIGDNFEEALFDKILLARLLPKRIVFAVRSRPILNDITLDDAKNLGIDKVCEVIESGSKIAGTDLAQCNDKFLKLFNQADMVISKGQGNYETLLNTRRKVYFLFKVKCEAIAQRCGFPAGTSVLYLHNGMKVHNV